MCIRLKNNGSRYGPNADISTEQSRGILSGRHDFMNALMTTLYICLMRTTGCESHSLWISLEDICVLEEVAKTLVRTTALSALRRRGARGNWLIISALLTVPLMKLAIR